MSKIAKGTLLTLVAGIAWGLSGTSGQYLMVHGFPVLVLTNIRLLIAGVLLVLYMLLTNQKKLFEMLKAREAMMSLVLFALLGLLLNQFAYLKSIYESMQAQLLFCNMSVQLEFLLILVSKIGLHLL